MDVIYVCSLQDKEVPALDLAHGGHEGGQATDELGVADELGEVLEVVRAQSRPDLGCYSMIL